MDAHQSWSFEGNFNRFQFEFEHKNNLKEGQKFEFDCEAIKHVQ